MKKNKKYIIFVLFALLVLFSVIFYNIAFASENSKLEVNKISDDLTSKLEEIPAKNSEPSVIRTYSHKGAIGKKGSGGNAITDDSAKTLLNYLNGNTDDDNEYKYQNVLVNYPSIFCLKHHLHLVVGKKVTWSMTGLINLKNTMTVSALGTYALDYKGNLFIYSAAFSEKREKEYLNERAQNAMWKKTGNWDKGEKSTEEGTSLFNAARALDEFDSQKDKNISISIYKEIADSTGIVLTEEENKQYYKIGPFKMSNYSYGKSDDIKKFSGGNSDSIIGGIKSGSIVLNNNTEIAINGSDCKIVYKKDANRK